MNRPSHPPTAPLMFLLSVFLCGFLSVSAQFKNVGKLKTWTTRTFERSHEGEAYASYLRRVHVKEQSTFDRVVFEFQGPMPHYNIHYLRARFYVNESGDQERIKIAGSRFIIVGFYFIRSDETQATLSQAKGFFPAGKLRMPSLLQLANEGAWEGGYDVLLGINSRRAFRVTELSNPARVVIDIKH